MAFHRYERPAEIQGPAVYAMGTFDGVHLGHRALFDRAIAQARERGAQPLALTFDPHPAKVLAPELAPPLLCTLARRLELMEEAGLAGALVLPFTRALAELSPEAFVAEVLLPARALGVVVGYDFTFGRRRTGTPEVLQRLGRAHGFAVEVVPPVTLPGGIVPSSSKIRELVLEGRVEAAATLLGRPFDIDGTVVRGAGRGTKIGIPTANLEVDGELLPAAGVYATRAWLDGARVWPSVTNIGTVPTFNEDEIVRIETHLIDWGGEALYGRRMRVAFAARLRGERRFSGPDALRAQIREDIEVARRRLAG
ncbi:MAG: riboflavin biosynthesis protein RibF [Deltaproteobacteria bacterium]|nr:MAG: riboflavin biosynthesis protein RibF [Deltaproteobacteria bacterium]